MISDKSQKQQLDSSSDVLDVENKSTSLPQSPTMSTSAITSVQRYKKGTPSTIGSIRVNPKKHPSARRKAKMTWRKAKTGVKEIYVVETRKIADGRIRKETKKRFIRV